MKRIKYLVQSLWDASALAKRYALENGSDTVDAIFVQIPSSLMVTTFLSLLTITDGNVLRGVEYMLRHDINAADAAILAAYLRYSQAQPMGSLRCVLIASDQRLLRAAEAEGLATLNPETIAPEDVLGLVASL